MIGVYGVYGVYGGWAKDDGRRGRRVAAVAKPKQVGSQREPVAFAATGGGVLVNYCKLIVNITQCHCLGSRMGNRRPLRSDAL